MSMLPPFSSMSLWQCIRLIVDRALQVKQQVEGDLRQRIAEIRDMHARHKQAVSRALSVLRAPKSPQQPLAPPSLSALKASSSAQQPAKKSAAEKQQSNWNEEVCLWLESMFSTILDDCEQAACHSDR